jgi:hypothetical protein
MVSPFVVGGLWSIYWEMSWVVWVSLVEGIDHHRVDPVGRRRREIHSLDLPEFSDMQTESYGGQGPRMIFFLSHSSNCFGLAQYGYLVLAQPAASFGKNSR